MTRSRGRLQVSLLTILLLVVGVAASTALWQTRASITAANAQLRILRPFKQQVVIHDPDRITAVREIPQFFHECVWQVHVPNGQNRKLVLAGEQVCELPPGKHSIEWRNGPQLRDDDEKTHCLLVNEEAISESDKLLEWHPRGENDGGLYYLSSGENHSPFVLAQKRVANVFGPNLLWIE